MMQVFWFLFLFLPSQPYGKPAPASVVLKQVPAGAEMVVALDAASLGHGMQQGLDELLGARFIQTTPALQQVATMIRAGRDMLVAKADRYGIDPFHDLRWVTISLGDLLAPEPHLLAVVGGKIPDQALAQMTAEGLLQKQGDRWLLTGEEAPLVVARARDRSLLVGTPAWVDEALAGRASNPDLGPLLGLWNRDTFALWAFRPSAAMHEKWQKEADWAARPLLASLEGLGLRLGFSGWSLKVICPPASLPSWRDLLYGLGRLAVAAREASDGVLFLAKGFAASLAPATGLGPDLSPADAAVLEALIQHRDEIQKLLSDQLIGPSPRTRVQVQKAGHSVVLQATGKAGGLLLLPMAVGAMLVVRTEGRAAPPVAPLPPPAGARPPAPPAERPEQAPGPGPKGP